MDTNTIRNEEAKEILNNLNEVQDLDKLANMIKDNKIEFTIDGKEYRIKLLSQKDKDELDILKRKQFGKLIQDKDILFEKELIKKYQEKGINIEEINEEILKINAEIKSKRLKLGEALEIQSGDSVLNTYKSEIQELLSRIYLLTIRKTDLLSFSFEQALESYIIKVMSFLALEIKKDGRYVRAFTTVDEYLNSNEELIKNSIAYTMALQYV